MFYITGDTHGDFARVFQFVKSNPDITLEDTMIVLGDAGLNYFGNYGDALKKEPLSKRPLTVFSIHGNHEMRPESVGTYREIPWRGGIVYQEEQYPNLLFAKDGELYNFDGKRVFVIGGAYSVDKYHRLARGLHWFEDEQPTAATKRHIEMRLDAIGWQVDIVLSHTCPYQYRPTEVFLTGLDQSTVDSSTEEWLEQLEARLNYKQWYCGHFHTDKTVDKLRFFFRDIAELK